MGIAASLASERAVGPGDLSEVALEELFGEKGKSDARVPVCGDEAAGFVDGGETNLMLDFRVSRRKRSLHGLLEGGVQFVSMEEPIEGIDVRFEAEALGWRLGEPALHGGVGLGFETAIKLGLLLGRELSKAAIGTSFVEHSVSEWTDLSWNSVEKCVGARRSSERAGARSDDALHRFGLC